MFMKIFIIVLIVVLLFVAVVYALFKHGAINAKDEQHKSYKTRTDRTREKGKEGEAIVAEYLKKYMGLHGKIINDSYFDGDRCSSQIDHILINENGVYVIETKNFEGTIYGDAEHENWLCYYPNGEHKQFYNPVKQNNGHVNVVKKILPENAPVFGIVVFVQNNANKILLDGVVGLNQLGSELNRQRSEKKLSQMQILQLYISLFVRRTNSSDSERQHIEDINRMLCEKSTICPRCGGALVERTGKRGRFIACSRYPKCNYTRNINYNEKFGA